MSVQEAVTFVEMKAFGRRKERRHSKAGSDSDSGQFEPASKS